MPDDPLDTGTPPPAPEPQNRKIVCEFCGCQVTPRGEIIKVGEQAKLFRKHDEIVEAKDKEIRRLETELSAVKTERDALKGTGNTGAGHRAGARVS